MELYGGSASRMRRNPLCSTLGDHPTKTSIELSNYPDDSFRFRGTMEVTNIVRGLTIDQITPKNGRNIQSHA